MTKESEANEPKEFQDLLIHQDQLAKLINKHCLDDNPNTAHKYITLALELKDLSTGIDKLSDIEVTFLEAETKTREDWTTQINDLEEPTTLNL